VQNEHAHGNVGFAVATFAGQTLPCARARQSLCRAYRCLCRAKWRTATPCSPVVHALFSLWPLPILMHLGSVGRRRPRRHFNAVQNEASHHHMCTPHRLEAVRFILRCVVTGSKLIDLDIPVVFVTAMPQIKLTYISALSDHPNYTMDTLVSTKVVKSQSSSQAMSAYDRDPSIAFSTVLIVAWVPVFC
jgi:hypothetical protein